MASPQRRTLAGRLLFIYAVAVLAVVILLGYFVERAAREALLDSVENGLVQEARAVADSMPEATSEVPDYVFRLAGDIDARVTVVGPDGIVFSQNDGRDWTVVDSFNYWTVTFASSRMGWAVGRDGRVTKLTLR